MRQALAIFLMLGSFFCSTLSSDARGVGRFLGALVARGAVVAATSHSASAKSYTPDTLTVAQLAQCIKKAGKLDDDSTGLEANRTELQSLMTQVDQSSATVDDQKSRVDTRSRSSVNSFNALVDRHNTLIAGAKARQSSFNTAIDTHNADVVAYNADCAKKYYADDLTAAQKLADNN